MKNIDFGVDFVCQISFFGIVLVILLCFLDVSSTIHFAKVITTSLNTTRGLALRDFHPKLVFIF